MLDYTVSRRALLAGAASMTAAASFGLPTAEALASAPMLDNSGQGWIRSALGEFQVTIVTDGYLDLGEPKNAFLGLKEGELEAVLDQNLLSQSKVTVSENILVLNTGKRLVVFDTGTGGSELLGPLAGQMLKNLQAAGIDPKTVDDVVLTHAHADHVYGLSLPDGEQAFPNALVHLSEVDYKYFTDEANIGTNPYRARGRKELISVGDRIRMIKPGQEVIPGVTALDAPGHTLGHTIFMISSGNSNLLNCGDLAHHVPVFTRHPEVSFNSDRDPAMMIETRKRYFDMIATDKLKIVGYHFPFPGCGHLVKAQQGYDFVSVTPDTV